MKCIVMTLAITLGYAFQTINSQEHASIPEGSSSIYDPRCPWPDSRPIANCSQCSTCQCGQMCCPSSCGSSCVPIPPPPELKCLNDSGCSASIGCISKQGCPGVSGARCTYNCQCGMVYLGCNGELLTNEQCNPSPSDTSMRKVSSVTRSLKHYSKRSSKVWSIWSSWSNCSATCGSGHRNRSRICLQTSCSGNTIDSKGCLSTKCLNGLVGKVQSALNSIIKSIRSLFS